MSTPPPRTLLAQRALVAGVCALAVGGSAVAQDDWDVVERPGHLSASIAFDSNIAVAVRCDDGQLETYIAGLDLPRVEGNRQTIQYALGTRPMRDSSWQTSRDGRSLFADLPAPLARRFRAGGDLQLRTAADPDEPARRYVVSLPPSPAAIDRVLAACGRPLVDPRDSLRTDEASADTRPEAPGGRFWARIPRPNYPERALTSGTSGMAVLSCLTEDQGGLRDCQVEVERPAGAEFGRAALWGARNARVHPRNLSRAGSVTFTTRFSISQP